MTSIACALAILAATCLIVGLLAPRVRPRRNKGFVEISPRYRSFFRQLGVTEAAHFLALPGETPHIVSGHPDRNVARIAFTANGEQWNAFLKCEHRVPWRSRLDNAVAGFGWVSRSLREAWTLQALVREGLPGPEWLAAGEDGQGRAFLLVREAPGTELRAILAAEKEPRQRRRIARRLGAALARLHTAGFDHPDLYAQHLFLDRGNSSICLLDWQRARLRRTLSWRERCRGLAALHATVDDCLATTEERLLCLRAYWRISSPLGVSWRDAVRTTESQARRLLARRHVREKRQPPTPPQAWICLEGEALCIAPALRERWGEHLPNYLLPRYSERTAAPSMRRRWPTLPDGAPILLVQRKQPSSLVAMLPRSRRSSVSPEQRQAALLLRLQRHGIAAPQVLAVGRRWDDEGRSESYLLTEPLANTCSLEAWLAYRMHRPTSAAQQARCESVLHKTGAILRRLHEASCYLDFGAAGCGLAVRQEDGQPTVVLESVDGLTPCRSRHSRRAARDLRRMQKILRCAGCGRSDLDLFNAGYLDENPKSSPLRGNPKSEIRNPKEIQKRKLEISNRRARGFSSSFFLYSGLRFLSDFGFRISDFRAAVRISDFPRRLLWGVRRWGQRPDWPHFAGFDWLDRIMDVVVTDRLCAKQGRTTGRWIVTSQAEEQPRRLSVYLKRHYELPAWRGWLATLWPWRNWSPAWREWQNLEWARRQNVPVPRPLAVTEYVGPWGQLQSALAVEELAGMLSLQQAIPLAALRQDARSFRRWKRALAAEVARLTRMLHDRRCFHKDLYLCHFFVADEDTRGVPAEGWRGKLHLIDLHRLAHHPLTWRIWQTKDLAQLLYASGIVGVDVSDRLAFWRAYRGEGPNRPRCWWVRRFVLYRWRRYRRHNARVGASGRREPADSSGGREPAGSRWPLAQKCS